MPKGPIVPLRMRIDMLDSPGYGITVQHQEGEKATTALATLAHREHLWTSKPQGRKATSEMPTNMMWHRYPRCASHHDDAARKRSPETDGSKGNGNNCPGFTPR